MKVYFLPLNYAITLSLLLWTLPASTQDKIQAKTYLSFQQGSEAFQRGFPEGSSCNSVVPMTRFFCLEGFHYARSLKLLSHSLQNWHLPPLLSRLEALGMGMALAGVGRSPAPSWFYLPYLSDHLFDGWVFMTQLQKPEQEVSCWGSQTFSYLRFCEFAKGRAFFFTGRKPTTFVKETSEGLAFAQAFHGITPHADFQYVARTLEGVIGPVKHEEIQNCLHSHHILDCLGLKK